MIQNMNISLGRLSGFTMSIIVLVVSDFRNWSHSCHFCCLSSSAAQTLSTLSPSLQNQRKVSLCCNFTFVKVGYYFSLVTALCLCSG